MRRLLPNLNVLEVAGLVVQKQEPLHFQMERRPILLLGQTWWWVHKCFLCSTSFWIKSIYLCIHCFFLSVFGLFAMWMSNPTSGLSSCHSLDPSYIVVLVAFTSHVVPMVCRASNIFPNDIVVFFLVSLFVDKGLVYCPLDLFNMWGLALAFWKSNYGILKCHDHWATLSKGLTHMWH